MEHFSRDRIQITALQPPSGILNNPQDNGINETEYVPQFNPDGSPQVDPVTGLQVTIEQPRNPNIVRDEVFEFGRRIVAIAQATRVDLTRGERPYSPLREEQAQEEVSQSARQQRDAGKRAQLELISQTAIDPEARTVARQTLEGLGELDMAPAYQAKLTRVRELNDAIASGKATRHERQEAARLRRELGAMSQSSRPAAFYRRRKNSERTRAAARRGMEGRATPARIAEVSGTSGRAGIRSSIRDNRRAEQELEMPANIVSTKGTIFRVGEGVHHNALLEDRRYIVIDTLPTPAQAFRPRSATVAGGPPISGSPAVMDATGAELHTIYINLSPPGQPIRLVPLMRGIENPPATDGRYYYEDGVPIGLESKVTIDYPVDVPLPQGTGKVTIVEIPDPAAPGGICRVQRAEVPAISRDSFSEADNKVLLQPLLSGEEAFIQEVLGEDVAPELLEIIKLRRSDLERDLGTYTIEQEGTTNQSRDEILSESLVAHESDPDNPPETDYPGIRPPEDIRLNRSHFRRYTHRDNDPRTTAQIFKEGFMRAHLNPILFEQLSQEAYRKHLESLRKPR